ncbi:MAG: sulfatase [Acidobacteriota bacterium]|nr:sulfatase [Acidobacteriota bacterium]
MKRTNTFFLLVICAAISLLLNIQTAAQSSKNHRRNVLLVISDDQGREMAGCYGNPVIKTPHLDHLAAEGVRFTNAFATVASCSPSRAVILTGLHQHTNGMYGLAHDFHHQSTFNQVRSLPRRLKESGYRTGYVGKFHVAPTEVYPFDEMTVEGDSFELNNLQEDHRKVSLQGNRGGTQMAEIAQRFMSTPDDRPFFLVVGFSDPHRTPTGFANEVDYPGINKVVYQPQQVRVPYHLPDAPEVRRELADYYQAVSRLDQSIGLLLKALNGSGKQDETLVIYLSDNGIPFPGAKTTLYDAGIHLPLVVRAPGLSQAGKVNNAMVSWADITPTILDWAGVQMNDNLPGRSFLPILNQTDDASRDAVFASHTMHEVTMYYPMRAVRTRRYKLIWNLEAGVTYPLARDLYESPSWQGIIKRRAAMMGRLAVKAFLHRPEYELYDLEKDPRELLNVVGRKEYRQVFGELTARLRRMMEATGDPWVVKFNRQLGHSVLPTNAQQTGGFAAYSRSELLCSLD